MSGEQKARHGAGVSPRLEAWLRTACAPRAASVLAMFQNTHNLRLKLRKFHGEHAAARMEDEIEAGGQQIDVAAQSLAHAALDAVALVSLAQHFAHGEADARRMPEHAPEPSVCGAKNQLMVADCRLRPSA